ncbi:unnamed protein product [Symbiodinium sp. CCMP2456]|nr:unnamed protein product [Symbiodinium sp. CCMP2456]
MSSLWLQQSSDEEEVRHEVSQKMGAVPEPDEQSQKMGAVPETAVAVEMSPGPKPGASSQSGSPSSKATVSPRQQKLAATAAVKVAVRVKTKSKPKVAADENNSAGRGKDKQTRASRGTANTFAGNRPPKDPVLREQFMAIRDAYFQEVAKDTNGKRKKGTSTNQDSFLKSMRGHLSADNRRDVSGQEKFRAALQAWKEGKAVPESERAKKSKQEASGNAANEALGEPSGAEPIGEKESQCAVDEPCESQQ